MNQIQTEGNHHLHGNQIGGESRLHEDQITGDVGYYSNQMKSVNLQANQIAGDSGFQGNQSGHHHGNEVSGENEHQMTGAGFYDNQIGGSGFQGQMESGVITQGGDEDVLRRLIELSRNRETSGGLTMLQRDLLVTRFLVEEQRKLLLNQAGDTQSLPGGTCAATQTDATKGE